MVERAVIIAVGSQTHQSQLTYARPRAMLPALGRPLVVRIMDRLYRAGIQHYTVVVGDDEGSVAAYLDTSWVPDAHIEFMLQSPQDNLQRTLTGLARRLNAPFILASYNSFTHANFPERLLKQYQTLGDTLILSGATTTLSKGKRSLAAHVDDKRVTGIVSADDGLLLTDLMVCGRSFVDYLAALDGDQPGVNSREAYELARAFIQTGVSAYIVQTGWTLQIETDLDLLTLHRQLLDEEQDAHILSELPTSVTLVPPVRIDPQVSVGAGAVVGPHVYLENGCSVGAGAQVRNALIMQRAAVAAGEQIADVIVSTRGRIQG